MWSWVPSIENYTPTYESQGHMAEQRSDVAYFFGGRLDHDGAVCTKERESEYKGVILGKLKLGQCSHKTEGYAYGTGAVLAVD